MNAGDANMMHLAPSPPVSLLDRLKYVEDHIIQLEIDYPPWAALHFNQPHRGVSTYFFGNLDGLMT